MPVYIVEAVGLGRAKIGYATNVWTRVQTIAGNCPVSIAPIAILTGGIELERELHTRFAAVRVHFEWFTITDELRAIKGDISLESCRPSGDGAGGLGHRTDKTVSDLGRIIQHLGGPFEAHRLLTSRGHAISKWAVIKWGVRNSAPAKWLHILAEIAKEHDLLLTTDDVFGSVSKRAA